MTKHRQRRNRRADHRAQSAKSPLLDIPFRQLHNPLAPVEFVSAEQIEQLHQASMHILENIGLDFFDDEALAIWEKAVGQGRSPGATRLAGSGVGLGSCREGTYHVHLAGSEPRAQRNGRR